MACRGGKSGAALVEGKPDESLLLDRVKSGEMPPGKKKLTATEIDTLRKWIAAGAKVLQPVEDKFYGDRMGGLTDPFGHIWYIATPLKDVRR